MVRVDGRPMRLTLPLPSFSLIVHRRDTRETHVEEYSPRIYLLAPIH